MTDVKIGVQADVAGAASGIKKVEAATAGLEKRLDGVGKTAARAADQVAKLEAIASRLSKALGGSVSVRIVTGLRRA